MKKNIIALLFYISVSNSFGQSWSALGRGAGDETYCDITALTDYDGNLCVGGWFDTAGSIYVRDIAKWNGTNWSGLGNGITNGITSFPYEMVTAMVVYNGSLYIGGRFDSVGGIPASHIAMWNGTTWSPVGTGVFGNVNALVVYNSNLYVAGDFDEAGGNSSNSIAMWNGITWSTLGSGITLGMGNPGIVNALTIYNNNLIVGGEFNQAGSNSANNIAIWNGSTWSTPDLGIRGPVGSFIGSLAVYNGSLYIGGDFDSAGGIKAMNIASWNGTNWSNIGTGVSHYVPTIFPSLAVYALEVYNGKLYAGGSFDSAGGILVNGIASWDESTWSALGSGIGGVVLSLHSFSGGLYVAGDFETAGGMNTQNIAEWSTPAGIDKITKNNEVNIYPNPNNGIFMISFSHPELVSGSQIIEVYNILGEKIYGGMLKQVQHDNTIDISNQPNGMYLYRVLNNDGSLVGEGKVVVQK